MRSCQATYQHASAAQQAANPFRCTIYDNNSLNSGINEDGSIDLPISMAGKAKKLTHEIEIYSVDTAGNTAEYKTAVVDGSIGLLKKVYIREKAAAAAQDKVAMKTGDKKAFILVGIDDSGNEVELNTAQTSWSILIERIYSNYSAHSDNNRHITAGVIYY